MRPTFDYLDKADKREKTETAAREAAAAGVYLCITLLVEGRFSLYRVQPLRLQIQRIICLGFFGPCQLLFR